MVLSSQLLADTGPTPKMLDEARHKGWLAGVALRLGCGAPQRNPYERDSEEHIHWEVGFDEGFAG